MFQNLNIKLKGDKVIWGIVIVLFIFSLLAVYSSTQSLAYKKYDGNTFFFLIKQSAFLILGMIIIYLIHNINYSWFKKFAGVGLIITICLLILTLSGMGVQINDGARWIRIPVVGLTIQTSDVAKVTLFIFLAKMLANKQANIRDFKKGFLPLILSIGSIVGLIVWENMSTAILISMTSFMMLFFGGVRVKYLAISILIVLAALFLVYQVSVTFDLGRGKTWSKRIEAFTSSDNDINKDYQSTLANIAVARGGFFGQGPGNGTIKNFLPHSYSDYIFAHVIEEFGLFGGIFLIAIYMLFLIRCIEIFRRSPYAFGAFLSLAFGFAITFQALINMGVNVGLLPVTGLTLPLVSMGGSSVMFTCIAIGLILSVSRYVDEWEGNVKKKKEVVNEL